MQLISTKFKIPLLLVLGLYVFGASTLAQTISLVPNLTATDYGFGRYQIVVGNTFYFGYQKEFFYRTRLAKYDGNTLTVIPNLNINDIGIASPFTAIGNTIYFRYLNSANRGQLAKYDGNTLTVVPNASTADPGYNNGELIVIGNILYFRYQNATNNYQLAKYDTNTNTLTVIPNPSVNDVGIAPAYSTSDRFEIIIGNSLYFKYQNATSTQLAKYDGNTNLLTLIPNVSPNDRGLLSWANANPIAIGNNIFFRYGVGSGGALSKENLAKYDGNTNLLSIIPNASPNDKGFIDYPIAVGNTLYYRYQTDESITTFQLAKYNLITNSLSVIPNIKASDYGYSIESSSTTTTPPIVIGTNLYFRYWNSTGRYQIAKYDGNTLSLVPNESTSDFGCHDYYIAVGTNLYCKYGRGISNSQHLAKYDGNTLTIINNASTNDLGYHSDPTGSGNSLYFRYSNSLGQFQLAKYNGNTLTVVPNASSTDGGFTTFNKKKLLVIGNTVYFIYWGDNLGSFIRSHLAKYDGNSLTILQNPSSAHIGVNIENNDLTNIGNTVYCNYKVDIEILQLAKYTDVTLPLNLTSFKATKSINNIILDWQTTNEVNVSHFSIQRSTDGVSFATLGQVNAKGSGAYNFTDTQFPTANTLFYRLQMVDKDGSFTFSPIANVHFTDKNKISISPNPASNYITISGSDIKRVQIYDNLGKLKLTTHVNGATSSTISIQSISKGLYQIKVEKTNGLIAIEKFIKN